MVPGVYLTRQGVSFIKRETVNTNSLMDAEEAASSRFSVVVLLNLNAVELQWLWLARELTDEAVWSPPEA